MSELKVQQNALIRGSSCWVRMGNSADGSGAMKTLGFCDSFRGTKNMQLQRAQVCGEIYPVSIDPQGISVSISISGFIPVKKATGTGASDINGSGDISIMNLDPDAKNFIETQTITKIPYLEFYDKATNTVVASFTQAIPQTFNITGNGGSYIKGDMQLEAITMSGGDDYTGGGLASSLGL